MTNEKWEVGRNSKKFEEMCYVKHQTQNAEWAMRNEKWKHMKNKKEEKFRNEKLEMTIEKK